MTQTDASPENKEAGLPPYPIPWAADSDAGVFMFNQREYWHAHEVWERVRMSAESEAKLFYQGLIQLAEGFVKIQQRQHKGALASLRKGLDKFRSLDDAVGDLAAPIDYKKLMNQSRGVRVSLLDQGAPRLEARPWDLWPRIEYRKAGD
jgi:hypothetical protein